MITPKFLDHFRSRASKFENATLRVVKTTSRKLRVRRSVAEAPVSNHDLGFMLTLCDQGGYGYAAMAGLELSALDEAFDQASSWVAASRGSLVPGLDPTIISLKSGRYSSVVEEPWEEFPILSLIHI